MRPPASIASIFETRQPSFPTSSPLSEVSSSGSTRTPSPGVEPSITDGQQPPGRARGRGRSRTKTNPTPAVPPGLSQTLPARLSPAPRSVTSPPIMTAASRVPAGRGPDKGRAVKESIKDVFPFLSE